MMVRSTVTKVLLALIIAGLFAWDQELSTQQDQARAASTQVESLVPEDARENMTVAMVTLEEGGGEEAGGLTFEFLRSKGRWRCRQAFAAVANGEALIKLVDTLLQSEGLLQSDVPERAADYGLGTASSWMVTLHGPQALSDPDGDVLLQVEVGDSLKALDGGFVRLPADSAGRDSQAVWAIDSDPRTLLARDPARSWLPPMLDARLVPPDWPGRGARVSRVLVERSDGAQYRLERREVDVPEARQLQGELPYKWVSVHADGTEVAPSPDHVIAFSVFLRLATWADMLDPERAEAIVMNRLKARMVIEPTHGDPLVLYFGEPDVNGTAPVVNALTQTLHAVRGDVVQMLLPDEAELLDAAGPNPWGDMLGR
ncbi:MAG: hypothetical protein ACI9EF_003391 [Pseudohongiellaceae bacterium]|jgi:hypothetical protein